MTQRPGDLHLSAFLHAVFDRAPRRGLIELRWPVGEKMYRSFYNVAQLEAIRRRAVQLAADHDVYFGVLPRWRNASRRCDLAGSPRVVWADCDGPDAARALSAFTPAPSLVVRSGTGENRHAFWLLSHSETLALVERANRRLAANLGADDGAVTTAGAILRLPETRNHKRFPPAPVELDVYEPDRHYSLARVVRDLPPDPAFIGRGRRPARRRDASPLGVAPEVYVHRLLGQRVGRSRKVRCPFHDDDRSSLHVYAEPERGWFCFGCRRGGTEVDLAAALWNRPTRGPGFTALLEDLERLLLPEKRSPNP
jgi:hypothetical protein